MVVRQHKLVQLARTFKGIGAGLEKALAQHQVLDFLERQLAGISAAQGGLLARKQGRFDLVIAIDPGDFLGQIGFALEIGPEAGHLDTQVAGNIGHQAAQPGQDRLHLILAQVGAEEVIDCGRAAQQNRRLRMVGPDIDPALEDIATGELFDQFTGPVDRPADIVDIEPLFKPGRGIGPKAHGLGGAAHRLGIERGRFQKDRGCAGCDFGVLCAHHASQGHRPVAVSDHQHLVIEGPVDAVERAQHFTRRRPPDDDRTAGQLLEVKGMHRLAQLEHDIVRNIHDIVDRADTGAAQAAAQPVR